jgi:hypothetical protein
VYDEAAGAKIDVDAARSSQETLLVKTHDLPDDDSPALYLVRDGRDALVSYAHYIFIERNVNKIRTNLRVYPAYALLYLQNRRSKKPQSLPPFRIYAQRNKKKLVKPPSPQELRPILHDLIAYNASFGGWGPNVQAWTTRHAPTEVLKFEDLIQDSDPGALLCRTLETLGYTLGPVANKTISFTELKKRRPDLYRRGKVGSHKDEMPAELEALFWEKHGHIMEQMGYSR